MKKHLILAISVLCILTLAACGGGEDGAPGAAGATGADGSDGANGQNGTDGQNWWDALGQTGAIKGKVLLEQGVPAKGATVSIGGTAHYAYADGSGKYSFPHVSVGKKDLLVSYSGYYTERLEGVPVTNGNTLTVRDVRLMRKRPPLAAVSSLGEFPTLKGKAAGDQSGYSVSSAGDVNGDGLDDILIGASGANANAGETYLIYGRPGMDLSTALSLSPDVTFTGKTAGDYSGVSVSSAGDVNGDGLDDILIGAYKANLLAGETYLIYGSASLSGGSLGTAGVVNATFTGKAGSDYSGVSVSSAGDVNGDGFDDILIGAYGVNSSAGETYLIYGSATLSGGSLGTAGVVNATFIGKAAYDYSGYSVSSAGDVNGDGLDDILIGARFADPNWLQSSGETYLIYGNATLSGTNALSDIGLSLSGATFTGKAQFDWSGWAVSGAGDVNGDGFDDILIGASGANSFAGETYLIYGSANLSGGSLGTAGVVNAIFTGKATDDYSGYSVSSAGDVNGDGFDDILIGARDADPNSLHNSGETYLIYGSAALGGTTSLSTVNATFTGKAAEDFSGSSVSSAGDVNGDGFDDILIGAYGVTSYNGETYLIMGRERGEWTAPNSLSGIRNAATADLTLKGKATDDYSGFSVSSAGDVNGDGLDDILIGAPGADPNGLLSGETYLIYGRPGMDLSTALSLAPDATFTGKAADDYSGWSVSSAGDVNGDGFDDILIGAYQAASLAGETYLIYGSANLSGTKTLDSLDTDSVPGATFTGKAAGDYSGLSVSTAGDVNGDGLDDILIGAYGADVGLENDAGETYLIYGSANLSGNKSLSTAGATFTGKAAGDYSGVFVSSAGDVNGDGFDDILIGAFGADVGTGETYLIYGSANLSGTKTLDSLDTDSLPDATFTGKAQYNYSGRYVSSAGDVNGDGFDDILIGAYGAAFLAGETYLIYGSAALSGTKTLDASDGDSVPGATFTGKASDDYSGRVSSAGDVNGDGLDDILIGAYGADPNAINTAGETYLIYGSATLSGGSLGAAANATFTGKAADDWSGVSVSSAGDVNGDGFEDILIGAYCADPNGADSGETYLFLGMGELLNTPLKPSMGR